MPEITVPVTDFREKRVQIPRNVEENVEHCNIDIYIPCSSEEIKNSCLKKYIY